MPLNRQFVGEFQISKGNVENVTVNLWDAVRKCKGTDCVLSDRCSYADSKKDSVEVEHLPCRVERRYLVLALEPYIELVKVVNDQSLMNFIGLHLVPLYLDLCQLKMEKMKIKSITYIDKKGEKKIDPLFDEVRKTHREIMSLCKAFGLNDLAKKAGFLRLGGRGSVIDPELQMDGDGDAYEEMAKGG